MTRPLAAREQRLIATMMLLALIAVAWLGILSPIVDGFADRAARRQELLARYARDQIVSSRLPALRAAAARTRREAAAYGIVAPDRGQATQALRDLVTRSFDRNAAVTKSVQEMPAPAGWVGVRADAEVSLPALTGILRQLQDGRPLIVIESLTIAADTAFRSGHLDTMDIRLELAAPVAPAAVH